MAEVERNYCHLIDHRRYDRNCGCRAHDNAYGIHGGGSERQRWQADLALYRHMRAQRDPMALPALIACLTCGWFFWNYHSAPWPWRGQLLRRFVKAKQ